MLRKINPAHCWCALFILSTITFSAIVWHLASSVKEGYRFIIIDDTAFLLPRVVEFQDAIDMHRDQAHLAAETMLNRSPGGLDNKDRLKKLFHPQAYTLAMKLVDKEAREFEAKSLHQKANIQEVEIQSVDNQFALVAVRGQLIRIGVFSDQFYSETLDFELRCRFMLDRNMLEMGRYPTIVTEFSLKTKPSTAL